MIVLLIFKIMLISVILIDDTRAMEMMFYKIQKVIFGEITPRQLPYLLNCSTCFCFWVCLITLLFTGIGLIDSMLFSLIAAYLTPIMNEILMLIKEKIINWLGKI